MLNIDSRLGGVEPFYSFDCVLKERKNKGEVKVIQNLLPLCLDFDGSDSSLIIRSHYIKTSKVFSDEKTIEGKK